VVVRLRGGMGNQMFQVAFGEMAAAAVGARLKFDRLSGFWRDPFGRTCTVAPYLYKDELLHPLGSLATLATVRPQAPQRVLRGAANVQVLTNCGDYNLFVRRLMTTQKVVLNGDWQYPGLLVDRWPQLSARFDAATVLSDEQVDLLERLDSRNGVVLAIRDFAESPEQNQRFSTHLPFLRSRISTILGQLKRQGVDQVYLVSSHKTALEDVLDFGSLPVQRFYGADRRFDEHFILGLFGRIHRHILLNSTLYWWASFLTSPPGSSTRRWVFDDFYRDNMLLPDWQRL